MEKAVDQGIVLRRINHGEKDRVVTLLTREHGKLAVFAKSVRSQKSKLSGGIELLSINEIVFIPGKKELKTLVGAHSIRTFDNIVKDIDRTMQFYESLKRLNTITEDGTGQEFFWILERYLIALDDISFDRLLVQCWLDLQVLNVSGLLGSIEVSSEMQDGVGDYFSYDFDKHCFQQNESGEFTQNDIKLIRVLGKAKSPIKLDKPLGSERFLYDFVEKIFLLSVDGA